MIGIYNQIKDNHLFDHISESEFNEIYDCLDFSIKEYKPKETIFYTGDTIKMIGVVVNGSVLITKENRDGDMIVVSEISHPDVFGEAFVCAGEDECPVTVKANQQCTILFIKLERLLNIHSQTCHHQKYLINNLLKVIAKKNMFLNQKIEIISKRTLREKILCYLHFESHGRTEFSIPYNREELASFIGSDRSALSAELSKLQKEGIIKYRKNHFVLLDINNKES